MHGENKNREGIVSTAFSGFSHVPSNSRVVYCANKPIERVVYCLNRNTILDQSTRVFYLGYFLTNNKKHEGSFSERASSLPASERKDYAEKVV